MGKLATSRMGAHSPVHDVTGDEEQTSRNSDPGFRTSRETGRQSDDKASHARHTEQHRRPQAMLQKADTKRSKR